MPVRDLADGPARSVAELESSLRSLLATITDPHLHALLDALFAPDTASWRTFRTAPAAKHYHQAYPHGLLEHALSVAEGVSGLAGVFGGVDRDLAVTGALLHDIGKLDEYAGAPGAIHQTDLGRLAGHIPLGYYRVRRLIEDLPGFPKDTAERLLHIVLSHHGTLEHGSPVLPCTREATLVHFVDNLGGRLGSFDRLERELPEGARWSPYDRALGCAASFPIRADAPVGAARPTAAATLAAEPADAPPSLFEAPAAA